LYENKNLLISFGHINCLNFIFKKIYMVGKKKKLPY